MHYDDKIDNDGGGTNNAGHRQAGAESRAVNSSEMQSTIMSHQPKTCSEHKSPNPANYQSYTDPRRIARQIPRGI